MRSTVRLRHFLEFALAAGAAVAVWRAGHRANVLQPMIDVEKSARIDELKQLSHHLLAERENERASIARELHDELGSSLTAVTMDMSWIMQRLVDQPALLSRLARAKQVLASTVETKRRIIHDLRPSMLDNLGLGPAIESHISDFSKLTDVPIEVIVDDDLPVLKEGCLIALFRIFQAALSSAAENSGATSITVTLRRDTAQIVLEVIDDGPRFQPATSLGVLIMQERAQAMGGTLEVAPRVDREGTIVRATLPCVAVERIAETF